jgi:MarR family transcriptional regulator, lower aerobic nicotinate degradation pathway regulator
MYRTTAPTSAVEAHLRYWLRYVSNHISHEFSLEIQSLGVSVAEWVVLRSLYQQPAMAAVLARRLGTARCVVSKLADRLERRGLLERVSNLADRRARTLTLTTRGERLVPELAAVGDAVDARFFGSLGPATRRTLEGILKWIVRRRRRRLRLVPLD